jgi:pimeloyl-ACP methyl ester carboxylesterase
VPSSGGVDLALHDLGGSGPPVLLCHPTGFLGHTWAPVAAELGGMARCWALDFRGHGDSTVPADGDMAWSGVADDVLAVIDRLGLSDVRDAGHSMGGAALLMAELRRPGTMAALWLYEPIVFPAGPGPGPGVTPGPAGDADAAGGTGDRPAATPGPTGPAATGGPTGGPVDAASRPRPGGALSAAARRRRPRFPSREAALANYASKPPLSRLAPAALRAYVEHGFRDVGPGVVEHVGAVDSGAGGDGEGRVGGGGIELKCRPEIEAAVFEAGPFTDTFARLAEVATPTVVAAGGDGEGPAALAPLIASGLPHGRLERHPTLSHFGPMEDPAAAATAIAAALGLAPAP